MRHKPTSCDYKSRIKTFVRGTLSFLGSVLTLSAEGQTAAAETFDREPLGTEFSSKSNTREGLRFGEQVHGDCSPGTEERSQESRGQRGAAGRPATHGC